MLADSPQATDFLMQLYKSTAGDPAAQASMYDVGAALGMEKTDAGKIAEDLIGNGLVEVKTLSGGIAITAQGLEAIQAGDGTGSPGSDLRLNSGPILNDHGRQALEAILEEIKSAAAQMPKTYGAMEELVIDIKTAETQLLSPKAKTAVLREVLRSLAAGLANGDTKAVSARVQQMVDASSKDLNP